MDFAMATFDNAPLLNHDEKTNTINDNGSGFTKQERSDPDPPDDQEPFLRSSKSARTDYFDPPNKAMGIRSDSLLSVSAGDGGASNNMLSFSSSSSTNGTKNGNQSSLFSFYQPPLAYIRNTGYGSGGLQAGMHMPVSRYKGPFTPSQWIELEHQALIYKHFVANVPVPSHLLNPLRKSLNTFLFPGSSSASSYAPNSYGWGTFHLGFSGNIDPEPGRCRRTDGKKWRCSRDAVPDQKYCERHINRGRHRSRKPVEGQNGHTVSAPTTPKVGPSVSSSRAPLSSSRTSTTSGGAALSSSKENIINRTQEPLFSIPNYNSLADQGAPSLDPLPNFIDRWSKDGRTDWTQLSMSIPMAASDFSSSSNSPAQEKLAGAPLSLSHDFDPDLDLDPTQKPMSNWVPISWGNSMGGPLGEALNQKNKNTSSGSEMWDIGNNYQLGSSPTGVLQKTTFVSLSNSSSGSSPKKEDRGGGFCDEMLLSTLASSSSFAPSL